MKYTLILKGYLQKTHFEIFDFPIRFFFFFKSEKSLSNI